MGKTATTTEEQIKLLEQRGMQLDFDKSKIQEILLDIGYYRLGFYWYPFEIDKNHNFATGTKFSDALALYYLDVDLRKLLLKCINRIEINFRTKLVYCVSNKYKKSPTWFIDPKVMNNVFIENIDKHYTTDFKNNNRQIKIHHKKYINDKYAPAWKTLEFFTFGTIFKIYKSLNEESIQREIANYYGIKFTKTFINYINTIVFIRNTCAHGGVLFDLNTPYEIKITPLINFCNSINKKHSLDSCIKVILYLLETISKDRKIEIENEIHNLFLQHSDNVKIKQIIETKMGVKFNK